MFKKLVVTCLVLAGPVLFTACAPDSEPMVDEVVSEEAPEQVETDVTGFAACGTGLICSLSPTSGATYCQSGSQNVYCCGSGQTICGGSCVARCEWRNMQSSSGGGCTRWKEEFCRNSSCGFASTGNKCCYTTTPGAC
ncbi:hypothetical protein ACLESO_15805 [Pyxidicoccus sp. 3LG]